MDASGIGGITPQTWARLADSPAKGDVLVARLALPDVTERLIAAIDSDGKRHLLVVLTDQEQELVDRDSRGIDVATRQLSVQGREPARYIDLICNDAAGHAVFDLFGGEVAATLASAGEGATNESIARLLGKWRRFWGHQPIQLLTREEQLGLFAELWFLTKWLAPKVGTTDAFMRWRGPFGARHDFESSSESVEVKATSSVDGLKHRISGIDQLAPPENGALFLFSLKIREEASAATSLASLVGEARKLCADANDALSHLENALAALGYMDVHELAYTRAKFRLVSERLFSVSGNFPRLTQNELLAGIPAGVDNIAYDIDLQTAMHLQIAENPLEYRRL